MAAVGAGPFAGAAFATMPRNEIGEWESLIGAHFLVGGTAVATLAAVERPAPDRGRPAALARSQPFIAAFEVEADAAPAGQRTYRIAHPAKGAIDLFLARGENKGGKAVLLALFN